MPGGDDSTNVGNGTSSRMAQPNGSDSPSAQRDVRFGSTNGTRKAAALQNGSTNGEKMSRTAAMPPHSYHGHDSEEVTRIMIQALSDMGYRDAADSVSRQSGYDLENPTVASFRNAILSGSWDEAEKLLRDAVSANSRPTSSGGGLILAPDSDVDEMRFWLREQKFLELLEQRNATQALLTLRSELTPLAQDPAKVHLLSSLLMCQSIEDLMAKAGWDGASGQSRRNLLSELSRCISPSVMLPESRLALLLQQVKHSQITSCLYHTHASPPSLYADHVCDRQDFPSTVAIELRGFVGEVWQIQFSHDGTRVAACGSAEVVVIWNTTTFTVETALRHDSPGIGNISWSPDDTMIATCSQDAIARIWDAKNGTCTRQFRKFREPVSGCVWAQDSRSCIIGTLDKGMSVVTADLCTSNIYNWQKEHRVQDICGSPDGSWLVAADDACALYFYNAATRELVHTLKMTSRPTSISISQDSKHLLVNLKDGELQLINLGLASKASDKKFVGHAGGDYLIRSAFGGAHEAFVLSGSEDGTVCIWHKATGQLIEQAEAHEPRCNVAVWSPKDPYLFLTGGDDTVLKVWTNNERLPALRARYDAARVQDPEPIAAPSFMSSNESMIGH